MPQEFFVCIAAQSHVRCPAFVKLAYWAQDLSSVIFSLLCSVHSVSRPKITAYWDVWGDASPLGLSCFCPCTRISSVCPICPQIPIELWEGKSRSQTSRAEVEVGASFELFPIVAILSFARRIPKGNLKKKNTCSSAPSETPSIGPRVTCVLWTPIGNHTGNLRHLQRS